MFNPGELGIRKTVFVEANGNATPEVNRTMSGSTINDSMNLKRAELVAYEVKLKLYKKLKSNWDQSLTIENSLIDWTTFNFLIP